MDKRRCPECLSRDTYGISETDNSKLRECEDCGVEYEVFYSSDGNVKEIKTIN